MLDEEFAGSLEVLAASPTPTLRRRLLALPGVGPETADAILLYALHHPVPVADEYLRRIVRRHQLLEPQPGPKGYEALAKLTRLTFAADPPAKHTQLFNEFHALTVAVGKAHCGRTAHCASCPLAADLQFVPQPQSKTEIHWLKWSQATHHGEEISTAQIPAQAHTGNAGRHNRSPCSRNRQAVADCRGVPCSCAW